MRTPTTISEAILDASDRIESVEPARVLNATEREILRIHIEDVVAQAFGALALQFPKHGETVVATFNRLRGKP